MPEPTRERLQAYWDSLSVAQQDDRLSFLATCRPDFEFVGHLAQYEVSPDDPGVSAEVKAVFDREHDSTFDVVEFGFDQDVPRADLFLARHPTLGWMVAVRDPSVNGGGLTLVWCEETDWNIIGLAILKHGRPDFDFAEPTAIFTLPADLFDAFFGEEL